MHSSRKEPPRFDVYQEIKRPAPRLRPPNGMTMAEFRKGTALILGMLMIVFFSICSPLTELANATIIKSIRTGSQQAYVRMVIETDAQLVPQPTVSVDGNTLVVEIADAQKSPAILKSEAYRNDVITIKETGDSSHVHLSVVLTFRPIRVKAFFLKAPHRFVIDAYRPPPEKIGDLSDESPTVITHIQKKGMPPDEGGILKNEERLPHEDLSLPVPSQTISPKTTRNNTFHRSLLIVLIVVTSILLAAILLLMSRGTR